MGHIEPIWPPPQLPNTSSVGLGVLVHAKNTQEGGGWAQMQVQEVGQVKFTYLLS